MVEIPEDKLVFKYSRSGGPGGQNVNKVNTRITVLFDVPNCGMFSQEQKQRLLERLSSRTDKDGVIRVVCQRYRTQKANREGAVELLEELVQGALKKRRVRKKTALPSYAKERRLEAKRRRSMLKKQRAEY